MALKTDAVGKSWPAHEYEVGREKIREYAQVIGFDDPVYFDEAAAKEAGFRGIVAPPMFVVVYTAGAMGPVLFDSDVAMNFAAMVHGGQEFEWGEPVISGDLISTTTTCKEIYAKAGKGFYVFETESKNQDGDLVCRATWTNIVRGVEE
jgi:Acyl dehydratase